MPLAFLFDEHLVVTEDRHTMPLHLQEHLAGPRHCPGILLVRSESRRQVLLEHLEMIAYAGQPEEFRDAVTFIP